MQRAFNLLILLCMCSVSVGCAMCQSPYDYCYPAQGGCCCVEGQGCGRVGSVFGPAPTAHAGQIGGVEVLEGGGTLLPVPEH